MPAPSDPGFAVYVHWPFCAQKCPYCDFNSHVRFGGKDGGWDEPRFIKAYAREIAHTVALTGGQAVTGPAGSVFFGGGTPSLMQPATVGAILEAIAGAWGMAKGAEITLEANPGSVEAARFRGYRDAGINRVSVGVQSLRPADLARLGRIHSVDEARAALKIATATFDRASFDLIYARPQQTPEAWAGELREAIAMGPTHLSLYQLTIEPATPYAALHATGKLVIPDDETARALYDLTQDLTTAAGLPAYEISNHARPGEESRHNLAYWRYGTYAGIGPGAHGRIAVDGVRRATRTEPNPEAWADRVAAHGHGIIESTPLAPAEMAEEMLLMGLRLSRGLDLDRLSRLTGHTLAPAAIAPLEALGLVAQPTPARLIATPDGRLVLNRVIAELAKGLELADVSIHHSVVATPRL